MNLIFIQIHLLFRDVFACFSDVNNFSNLEIENLQSSFFINHYNVHGKMNPLSLLIVQILLSTNYKNDKTLSISKKQWVKMSFNRKQQKFFNEFFRRISFTLFGQFFLHYLQGRGIAVQKWDDKECLSSWGSL